MVAGRHHQTHDTVRGVRGVPRCGQDTYCTRNCATLWSNTTVFQESVVNPKHAWPDVNTWPQTGHVTVCIYWHPYTAVTCLPPPPLCNAATTPYMLPPLPPTCPHHCPYVPPLPASLPAATTALYSPSAPAGTRDSVTLVAWPPR